MSILCANHDIIRVIINENYKSTHPKKNINNTGGVLMDMRGHEIAKYESEEYLKIIYNNNVYLLNDFAMNFQDEQDEFSLDRLIKNCKINYMGKVFTYKEMLDDIDKFKSSLLISDLYFSKIYPVEKTNIFIIDRDYYAAGKLIESAEKQLSFGRWSLIQCKSILDFNVNCNWLYGYKAIYNMRSIKANNAIMWYNNVFDSIMQIIFIGFEIYKKHPWYKDKYDYHETIKLCSYSFLSDFYNKNKTIPNLESLWEMIKKAHAANKNVREWANSIKHRGGINYKGDTLNALINVKIKMLDGKTTADKDFEPFEVNLDDVIDELKNLHIVLHETISNLVDFMNFEKVRLIKDGNNLIIPEKATYKKIIIA